MNGKCYSEERLLNIIGVARQYIEAEDVRDRIISKCHLEMGLILTDAPFHQRAAVSLTDQESAFLMTAIRRWQGQRN